LLWTDATELLEVVILKFQVVTLYAP
jgi:hypothetical protein